jgi:hypothetical protein
LIQERSSFSLVARESQFRK